MHGRNVPIPILPSGIPPESPKNKIPPHPNSTESFDLGISLPIPPTTPEPLTSQMAQTVRETISKTNNIPVSPQTKQKPPVPLRPTLLSNRDTNIQIASSEMESDDYHHISEHLQRAAAKINKTKLAITLQDKDKPPSRLSESDEESVTDPSRYPYNDGEVVMKKIMSPAPWGSTLGKEGEYLLPREPPLKTDITLQDSDLKENPTTSMPFSPPSRMEINQIEDELRNWTGAGTRMDDRYYSYSDEGCLAKTKPIEDAIIYHPPARQFVRVQGPYVRVIALMPITMSQLEQFKNVPCHRCYDPVKENLPNEDLAWDNFQRIHSGPDSVYETPNVTNNKKQSLNVGQGNGSTGLNSFGTAINTLRHLVDLDPVDSYVEELLETKQCLQEQLQEISSEGTSEGDKGKELPFPLTLGEHQMRYLHNWQSVRDVLEPRSKGHPWTNSHHPPGEINTHLQQNLHEHRTYSPPTNDPSAPSKFSQVAHLKKYLQLNIKVLQDQIDWNTQKIHSDKLLRDQGTSMTPKMQIKRGTNTERDSLIESAHEEETPFCFHCSTHGHKVYRCTKPGRERQ